MADEEPLAEGQEHMGYQTAKLNKATGFAVAHLETLAETGEERIMGVFKSEHTFFRKYTNSRRKMTYEGFVEHDGVIYGSCLSSSRSAPGRSGSFRRVSRACGSGSPASSRDSYAVREPTADTAGLGWLVPSYIFTRVRRFPLSWELLEAVENNEVAGRLLADYRAFLEGQSEVEVVLVEAASARQARRKLEARGAEPN